MAKTNNPIPARMDKSKPIYRVLVESYIDDQLLDPESTPIDPETDEHKPLLITFEGDPGFNLEPWNELAQKKWSSIHPNGAPAQVDPIAAMTKVTADTSATA